MPTLSRVSAISPLRTLVPSVFGYSAQLVGNLRFTATRSAMNSRSAKVFWQATAISQGRRLVAETRVGVSLVVKTKDIAFPLLEVDRLSAIEIIPRLLVLAQMAMDQSA